jgi:predicted metal-binding protein
MDSIIEKALKLGANNAVPISTDKVVVANWVRLKCQYGCGGWGKALTCPPYSPTPQQMVEILREYKSAILVHKKGSWSDIRENMAELERDAFLAGYYKAFSLPSGPCRLCEKCYVNAPCKHPREARPSMEACGIDVFGTARAAGMPIQVVMTRDDEPNFYGLLLLE